MYCQKCGEEIDDKAISCPRCGVPTVNYQQKTRSPGLAAVLSFFIPGLGQVYNGQVLTGIGCMVIAAILAALIFIGIGLILYPIFWLYCVYDAYNYKPSV